MGKFNKKEIEHIGILIRRKEFLQNRIDQTQAARSGSYDQREHDAIVWALERIKGER